MTATDQTDAPSTDDSSDDDTVYHPGEILRRDFLQPMNLSSNALAMALRVPPPRITELVRGRRGVTADTALRLARYLGTSAEFWLALQAAYDLAVAWGEQGTRIESDITPRPLTEKSDRKHLNKVAKKRTGLFKAAL